MLPQQAAVQLGHPVGAVAAHHGQMGHAHPPLGPLLDQRQAGELVRLPGKADPGHPQEAGVDLVDDLQVARQQLLEQLHAPGFQRLRQQGVVGVAEAGRGDLPGRIPVDAVHIDQQPHQLGHSDGRVGVVHLHRILAVELAHRQPLTLQDPEHVLQGAAHEEDLLAEPQPFALLELIVGVEHLGEGFRLHLAQDGAGVVAGIEGGEIEGIRRRRRPQPQGVGRVHAEAEDRCVVGHADHGVAADLHRIAPLRADHLPGIALGQPGIGALLLALRSDLLAEDAELVADAVADRRQLEAGHRLLETGGQPPQAPIAQARFRLEGQQLLQLKAELPAGQLGLLADAQIHQVVVEVGTEQVFGGEVHRRAHLGLGVGLGGLHPVLQQAVAHRQGQGPVVVMAGGQRLRLGLAEIEMAADGLGQFTERGGLGHGAPASQLRWVRSASTLPLLAA